MARPTSYDAANPSTTKFPAYFDGKNFAYEYGRAWIKTFTGGTADLTFPHGRDLVPGFPVKQPIDMDFGPDGALYVLDYGTGGFFQGDANSAVYRDRLRLGRPLADRQGHGRQDVRPGAADGQVLRRGLARPGRHPAHVRVGLRR